jgi:MFS family permease
VSGQYGRQTATSRLGVSRRTPELRRYLAIAAVFFLNAAVFANWVPRIPTIQNELRLDNAQLGLALLGLAAGQLIMLPFAGRLVTRLGSRRAAVAAAVVSSIAIALPPAAGSLAMLTLVLMLLGITGAILDVAMNSQGIELERIAARTILPYFHAAFSLGSLVGAAMGSAAAALGLAPEPHLLAAGGLFALLGLASAPGLLPADPQTTGSPGRPHLDRFLISLGLLAWSALLVEGAVTDWSAVFMRTELQASAGAAGAGYIAFAATMFVGALAGPRLSERYGSAQLIRVGGLLTTASTALIVLPHVLGLAILGFAGIGAALACTFPLILSTAGRHPTALVGTSVATVSIMGYTGFLAGPPLIGFIAEATSLSIALGLAGMFGLVLFFFADIVDGVPSRPATREPG